MAKRDYYEILGVPRTATADEIKKAHRKLVRKHHPDVNKNNKASEEKFKEAQEAYDVLSDPGKRRNYDQFGHAGVGAGGAPGAGGDAWDAFRRQQGGGGAGGRGGYAWRPGPGVSVEDFEGGAGGDFGDIFEQLFGGRGGAGAPRGGPRMRPTPQPPQQQRGSDVEHPVTLTFEQAARGTTLPLQINRDGRLETIDIKIPAGVNDGSRVRIKGKGQESNQGEPGDLFIITRVTPHPFFRRDGLDILLDVPISVWESMLGTKVDVPTMEGSVTLSIPPGTGSGAKMRIKGRGIERGNEKGDQFCVIKIIVPKGVGDEDKDTIRKLAEKYPLNPRADIGW
jgi:curved DNA-binding protein